MYSLIWIFSTVKIYMFRELSFFLELLRTLQAFKWKFVIIVLVEMFFKIIFVTAYMSTNFAQNFNIPVV